MYICSLCIVTAPGPSISVTCDHIWDTASGHFNISVVWSLQPNNTPTDHITGFTVTPSALNNGELEMDYSPQTIVPQVSLDLHVHVE